MVLSVIDEGDFEIEKEGAMFEFIKKIKEKFEASHWKKCRDTWDQITTFKRQKNEGPKEYLEKWSELETEIRNSGEAISPMFLANHFTERIGLPDTTKQSILTVVSQPRGERDTFDTSQEGIQNPGNKFQQR